MKNKKTLLVGAALLLGAMGSARAEILVGFVTGLSGPVSSIGVPNAKGLAAGQAYIGEIDGEKVRVIQLDDGSDPAASTRNARKLVEQEKVDFLLGTSGAPQTLAMATAAIEMKVPMVAVSPIAPVPAGDGGPWVVQIPQPTPLLVQGIVDHMKGRTVKTVAFVGFSDAFGDLMYNSLLQAAEKADIKVIANERYARSDNSVTAQVLRAISARPDAIMLGGTGTPGALPVIALAERGYKGPLYGNHGMISADFLRLAGIPQRAARGAVHDQGCGGRAWHLHLHAGRSPRRRQPRADHGSDREREIQAAAVMAAARGSGVAQLRLERAHVDCAVGTDGSSRERLDLAPGELARRRQRQFVNDSDIAGHLVIGEALGAGLDDRGRERVRVVDFSIRHDEGKNFLAANVVGNGCHRAAADPRVHVQRAFDLEHADVFAAAPHDGLLAIEEIHQPAFVGEDEVAGVEPAVLPRRFGGFFIFQVTAEETGTGIFALGADQQLAGFPERNIGAVIVDEAILHAFRWAADAARAKACRFARSGGGRRPPGLGHRPRLDDRDTVTLLEGGAMTDVDAGREGKTHAMLPFNLGHGQLQQNGRDYAETMHDGRAAIGHTLPPAVGVKAVERNHGAAEHHHADRAAAERVHVKHRQWRQVDLAVRL